MIEWFPKVHRCTIVAKLASNKDKTAHLFKSAMFRERIEICAGKAVPSQHKDDRQKDRTPFEDVVKSTVLPKSGLRSRKSAR